MPDEAPQQETPAPEQQQSDPIATRLDEFRGEVMGRLDQLQQPQQEQGYSDPGQYDPNLDPAFQQGYPPYQEGQQPYDPNAQYQQDPYAQQPYAQDPSQLQQQAPQVPQQQAQDFNAAVHQAVQQELQPWRIEQEQSQRQDGLLELEEQIPELATQEGAQKLIEATQPLVGEVAGSTSKIFGLPQEAASAVAESILTHPTVLEMIYKAQRADLSAAQETPAGTEQGGVQLEQDAGQAPPQQQDDAETVLPRRSGGPQADYWGV